MASFLKSIDRQLNTYKQLAEKAMIQIEDKDLFWRPNEASNSIGTLVKHMSGNMLSRWTNFLTEDGEKPWRDREGEFENDLKTRDEVMQAWNKGWQCFFDALATITDDDLDKTVTIGPLELTLMEAINRQMVHYTYHIGQIVYIAKMEKGENWETLSIPKKKQTDSKN